MKSVNHVYEAAVSHEIRAKSVHRALIGRRDKGRFTKYSADEEKTVADSYEWITNYKIVKHKPIEIYDGISRKKRSIIVPTFPELVVQHCVVLALMPMFMRGMYEHSYGSIPDRGAHKGRCHIQKWIRDDPRNCKYVLKMDIRHFFDSIPHDRIKKMLRERIHDERMIGLLDDIIDTTDKGLPLGFYTSQWLANWYLEGLDHYIKESLKAAHYIRYMDDMVVFGSNKRELHKMRVKIEEYLETKLGLKLKDNYQVYRFDYTRKDKHHGRDLDFMGFRFYRDKVIMRKSIMLKATRKVRKVSRKEKATIYDVRQTLSYLGWIKHTDTYGMYLTWIKPYVNIGYFKDRISNYDRKRKETKVCLGKELKAV